MTFFVGELIIRPTRFRDTSNIDFKIVVAGFVYEETGMV